MTSIKILTLTWDGLDRLKTLKDGLYNNLKNTNHNFTWYIRDNGSKDNTVSEASSWCNDDFDIKCFDIGHNKHNFSQGINYLLNQANPNDDDLILLLNNDIEFNDNESLNNMIKLMKSDVGVVGTKLLYPGTNKLQHAGVIFSERYGKMPFHFRSGEVDDLNSSKNRYFQAVTAACCLIKASELKRIGGLKIGYSWAFEDVDMVMQIGQNKKIAYCGNTNISHFESATLKRNPVNTLFLQSNVKLFKDTWFGKYEIDHEKYLKDPNYNLIL